MMINGEFDRPIAVAGAASAAGDGIAATNRLVANHFSARLGDVADPADLAKVPRFDPFLRHLLFTDGTVTRALEVHTLERVTVETVEQVPARPPIDVSAMLDCPVPDACVRRRVTIHAAGPPLVWAETFLAPDRLPAAFVRALDDSEQGIGQSMQGLMLESRRELLKFKLGPRPRWAPDSNPATSALMRVYRIVVDEQPGLVIAEAFAVEEHLGGWRLSGLRERPAHRASLAGDDLASEPAGNGAA